MVAKTARCLKCGRTGKVDATQTCECCLSAKKVDTGLEAVIGHLQKALSALGNDFATLEVRSLILSALAKTQHQSSKRLRRAGTDMDKFVAAGLTAHDRWWKQIEQSIQDAAKKVAENKHENKDKPAK